MPNAALPQIDRITPRTHRVVLMAAGIALLAWSLRALWQGSWQLDPLSLVGILIALGGIGAALLLIVASLAAESRERWQYPPRALVIHRRVWGREGEIRLDAANVASIQVLHLTEFDMPDRWRVTVRPRAGMAVTRSRWVLPDHVSVFETDDFASREAAEAAQHVLREHLGMPALRTR